MKLLNQMYQQVPLHVRGGVQQCTITDTETGYSKVGPCESSADTTTILISK